VETGDTGVRRAVRHIDSLQIERRCELALAPGVVPLLNVRPVEQYD
jgi:hypothetical protein